MNVDELLRRVPREAFVPDVIWVRRDDGSAVPLRRADDPDRWLALVRSDDSIITQVDDGATERGVWPTSSASAPHIVATMLEALDVEPGMKVLEIGTGTSYNAALLAELVGPQNVTSVEIDPGLAEQARAALARAGCHVQVVTGDGTHGHAANAPYDRVIATAAACRLPYAWVRQTRPGGRILAPGDRRSTPTIRWRSSPSGRTGRPKGASHAPPGSCRCGTSGCRRTSGTEPASAGRRWAVSRLAVRPHRHRHDAAHLARPPGQPHPAHPAAQHRLVR